MNTFELGLLLMAIGMATVFAILWIVIGLGKALIVLVNKYAPEQPAKPRPPAASAGRNGDVPEPVTAAIVAAVGVLSSGNGKVVKIER